jgi:antitoxin HicB
MGLQDKAQPVGVEVTESLPYAFSIKVMIEGESNRMAEYSYTVLFEPAEEGGFVVTCPALPGLVTEGDTMEEARAMAQDAIRAYIESLRKDHLPPPVDRPPVKEEIRVLVPEQA